MTNIKVTSKCTIYDGMSVTFKAPCDCSAIQGLTVKDHSTTKTFTFKDTHGNTLTGVENLFSQGAYIKVVLDTTNNYAYIQNADSNGYLEEKLNAILTDETKALYGMDSSAVPNDVFAAIPGKIHNDNSNLHGQWMEKQVGPGISVKTGELVNLVDNVATRKFVMTAEKAATKVYGNTGTSHKAICAIDENHICCVYSNSTYGYVLEVGEDGTLTQVGSVWINTSGYYEIFDLICLNRNYVVAICAANGVIIARLIYIDDEYNASESSHAKSATIRSSQGNPRPSSTGLDISFVAASETEAYFVCSPSSNYKPQLVKLTFDLNGTSSSISVGNVYEINEASSWGATWYLYPMPNHRCLMLWHKPSNGSIRAGYNDLTAKLFDMSGNAPVLLQEENLFVGTSSRNACWAQVSSVKVGETDILGIYTISKVDNDYNFELFKCHVNGDTFSLEKASFSSLQDLKFGHYLPDKKIVVGWLGDGYNNTDYPSVYYNGNGLNIFPYATDVSINDTNVHTNVAYPLKWVWMPDDRLVRIYHQISTSYDHYGQVMDFIFSASEYLAVSDAETGEMVKLGINGNFNVPNAVAGDSYALAERIRANAYMNGIMSFLPEPYEMASGSYVGTGNYTYTNNNYIYDPVVLNFDFVPKAVLITMTYTEATNKYPIYAMVTPYGGICFESHSYAEFIHYFIGASVSGTSITIDFPRGYTILQQSTSSFSNSQNPLNAKNCVYHYTAWGSKE